MNRTLRDVIRTLDSKRIIGHKHIPEDKLLNQKIKWLKREERKQFEKEYKELINRGLIIRLKKRTGKDYDWHISLNPRKLKEINEMIS
jgi:hypothetical protein